MSFRKLGHTKREENWLNLKSVAVRFSHFVFHEKRDKDAHTVHSHTVTKTQYVLAIVYDDVLWREKLVQ